MNLTRRLVRDMSWQCSRCGMWGSCEAHVRLMWVCPSKIQVHPKATNGTWSPGKPPQREKWWPDRGTLDGKTWQTYWKNDSTSRRFQEYIPFVAVICQDSFSAALTIRWPQHITPQLYTAFAPTTSKRISNNFNRGHSWWVTKIYFTHKPRMALTAWLLSMIVGVLGQLPWLINDHS